MGLRITSTPVPAAFDSIIYVVGMGSFEKVVWVYAWWVIARMARHSVDWASKFLSECSAVCKT